MWGWTGFIFLLHTHSEVYLKYAPSRTHTHTHTTLPVGHKTLLFSVACLVRCTPSSEGECVCVCLGD